MARAFPPNFTRALPTFNPPPPGSNFGAVQRSFFSGTNADTIVLLSTQGLNVMVMISAIFSYSFMKFLKLGLNLNMPPAILYYAIPGFLILLSLEAWFSHKENKHLYETKDTWSSLGLGIGNVLVGFVT